MTLTNHTLYTAAFKFL